MSEIAIGVDSTENVTENSKNKLKTIWNNVVSKWNKDNRVTAKDAYLKATYGIVKNDEERLNDFMVSLDELIALKSDPRNCQFCAAIEVPKDLLKFLPQIIEEYTTRNFTILNLNEKLEEINNNYLFLCWDNKY